MASSKTEPSVLAPVTLGDSVVEGSGRTRLHSDA